MSPTDVSPASGAAFRKAVEVVEHDDEVVEHDHEVVEHDHEVVEHDHEVVYTVGMDGRITFLGPTFETMTGWPGGAWIGLPLTALMDHDDARRADRIHRAVIDGDRPAAFIVRLRTRARGSITAELIVAPRIEQGGVIAVAGVVREISPGVGAERRHGLAVKRDAICRLDGRERIVALNGDAERMFRVSTSQVMDQPLTALVSRASQQTVRRDVAEFFAFSDGAVEATTIDAVGRRGDGSEFPLKVGLARWRTDAGAFVMAILRDTTESQVAQAAFHRLNDMQEDTARRISRELHDEAGQLLIPLHIALQEWARELSAAASPHLRRITDLLDQIEVRLRDLSHELRPMLLDDLGLVPALEFLAALFAKRTAMGLTVAGSTGGRLPSMIETALYRVAQEALTNVARHAHATAVRLTIAREGPLIHCAVGDNGIGFNVAALRSRSGQPGLGLIGIRERVESLGGTVQIESAPEHGTILTVAIPLGADPFRRG